MAKYTREDGSVPVLKASRFNTEVQGKVNRESRTFIVFVTSSDPKTCDDLNERQNPPVATGDRLAEAGFVGNDVSSVRGGVSADHDGSDATKVTGTGSRVPECIPPRIAPEDHGPRDDGAVEHAAAAGRGLVFMYGGHGGDRRTYRSPGGGCSRRSDGDEHGLTEEP